MKQTYLIDGYNLLHAMGVLLGRRVEGPHVLEKARNRLLSDLAQSFDADTGLLTVVFDAASSPRHSLPEQTFQGIRVLFAVGGPEADDLIENLIAQHPHPKNLSVVSDDHRLQRAARRRQAKDMSCSAFLDLLEQRRQPQGNAQLPAEEADEAKQVQDSQEDKDHWLAEFGHLQKEIDRHDLPVRLEKLPPAASPKQKKQPKRP